MSHKQLSEADRLENYLQKKQLCIKKIPNDSSIFRALSEEIYHTQTKYTDVQELYAKEVVQSQKLPSGNEDLAALSELFQIEILVYAKPGLPTSYCNKSYSKQVRLCKASDDHYDLVLPKSRVASLGLCQSIVYEHLYSEVLGVTDSLAEARTMLQVTENRSRNASSSAEGEASDYEAEAEEMTDSNRRGESRAGKNCSLPYKVAKALDPGQYRNTELDMSKEKRQTNEAETAVPTGDESGLTVGDRCQVWLDDAAGGSLHSAVLQHVDEHQWLATVFVEQFQSACTVPVNAIRQKICRRKTTANGGHSGGSATLQSSENDWTVVGKNQRTVPNKSNSKLESESVPPPMPQNRAPKNGRQWTPRRRKEPTLYTGAVGFGRGRMSYSDSEYSYVHKYPTPHRHVQLINSAGRPLFKTTSVAASRENVVGGHNGDVTDSKRWARVENQLGAKPNQPAAHTDAFPTLQCQQSQQQDVAAGETQAESPGPTNDSSTITEDASDKTTSLANTAEPSGPNQQQALPRQPALQQHHQVVHQQQMVPAFSQAPALPGYQSYPPTASCNPWQTGYRFINAANVRQLIPPHVEQHPPVNYNAKASIDPAGKDLPFNDLQTMVYFYNLGVECYRLTQSSTHMNQPQPYDVTQRLNYEAAYPDLSMATMTHAPDCNKSSSSNGGKPCSCMRVMTQHERHTSHDSGCASDQSERRLTDYSDNHSDSSSQHSLSAASLGSPDVTSAAASLHQQQMVTPPTTQQQQLSQQHQQRPLRPMKDIPPRFQKLLQSANKTAIIEKSSCHFEGQPLMRANNLQKQRHPLTSSVPPPDVIRARHAFNPDAQSFIPSHFVFVPPPQHPHPPPQQIVASAAAGPQQPAAEQQMHFPPPGGAPPPTHLAAMAGAMPPAQMPPPSQYIAPPQPAPPALPARGASVSSGSSTVEAAASSCSMTSSDAPPPATEVLLNSDGSECKVLKDVPDEAGATPTYTIIVDSNYQGEGHIKPTPDAAAYYATAPPPVADDVGYYAPPHYMIPPPHPGMPYHPMQVGAYPPQGCSPQVVYQHAPY